MIKRISEYGSSGLMLMNPNCDTETMWLVYSMVVQSLVVEVAFLTYLALHIRSKQGQNDGDDAPMYLVLAAIWLHIQCLHSSFYIGYRVLAALIDRLNPCSSDNCHIACCVYPLRLCVVLLDSFIIPSVTMVLGAFLLAMSDEVPDLILNSAGLYFISQINDHLINMNQHRLTTIDENYYFGEPEALPRMFWLLDISFFFFWVWSVVPLFPVAISMYLYHVAKDIYGL